MEIKYHIQNIARKIVDYVTDRDIKAMEQKREDTYLRITEALISAEDTRIRAVKLLREQ